MNAIIRSKEVVSYFRYTTAFYVGGFVKEAYDEEGTYQYSFVSLFGYKFAW